MEKGQCLQINGIGKTGQPHAKEQGWILVLNRPKKVKVD